MSEFNADAFMQTEVEGTGDTDYTPIAEGEYNGVMKEVKASTTPNGAPLLEITWIIDNEEVRKEQGLDEPTCRQTVWLDINDAGVLEFGKNKNIGLNRLREAVNQNDGTPWSPNMLVGQPAMVSIKHRLGKEGQTFTDVKGVRAIG